MATTEKITERDCIHCGFAMGEREGEPLCDHCSPKEKMTEVHKEEPIVIHTKYKEPQIGTHKDLEKHGLSPDLARNFMPGRCRFPGSRDWDLEGHVFPCARNSCAANYMKDCEGRCVMPSLIKIDRRGKCIGYHPRMKTAKKKTAKKKFTKKKKISP